MSVGVRSFHPPVKAAKWRYGSARTAVTQECVFGNQARMTGHYPHVTDHAPQASADFCVR